MRVKIIGIDGRMGQIHAQTYRELGLEIVESGEDIVSIASPDQTHGRHVLDAIYHQKHVFCEKPLSMDYSELLTIEHLSESRADLHIGQNFPLRYAFAEFKSEISSNRLGTIYRAEFAYEWARSEKLGQGWRTGDYSLVMGGLIHMADLAIWLFGDLKLFCARAQHGSSGDWFGAHTVVALCEGVPLVTLTMDGGKGPKAHGHHLVVSGTNGCRGDSNFKPTDKTAAIRDFVKNLRHCKPPQNDFRATRLCLEIDECIASTSPAR